MATLAQITANHQNAILSTGPRTPSGKQRSATNATSHGLSTNATSAPAVLPHEDAAEYEALFLAYSTEFHPATEHELFLIQQMTHARWRLARIQRLEIRYLSGEYGDDATILAKMSRNDTEILAALQRYAAAAERSYYKAHKELETTRHLHLGDQAHAATTANKQAETVFMNYLNEPPPQLPRQDLATTHTPKPHRDPHENLALRL